MVKTKDLAEILEQIQAQLKALSERVDHLEAASLLQSPAAVPLPVVPIAQEPLPVLEQAAIPDEEIIAIAAALGAYLGVRVRIRRIRLLGSRVWAQQGRVSIQASHNLYN